MKETALVTGAASGIGKYIADCLELTEKYTVIRLDKESCENNNFHQINLMEEKEVENLIDSLDKIDIAVNCAGVPSRRKQITDFQSNELLSCISQNLFPLFNCMKYEIISMRNNNTAGLIINLASVTAYFGMKNFSAYSSAKAAIVNLTKVAAHENCKNKIRINSISPATIDTPWIRRKYNGELRDYSDVFYTGNCGTVQDVFSVVKMLIENKFLTGADIRLDGGLSDLMTI